MKRILASALMVTLGLAAVGRGAVWTVDSTATTPDPNGNWSQLYIVATQSGWNAAAYLDGISAVAQYADASLASVVSLDVSVTVGKISIENRRAWTIDNGGGSLTMNVGSTTDLGAGAGKALIQGSVSNQNPDLTINPSIVINVPLTIQTAGTQNGDVIVHGGITGVGDVLLNQQSTSLNFRGKYAKVQINAINTVGSLTAQTAASGDGKIEIDGTIGSNVTSLTKTGAQELTLLGTDNAYTGGTSILGGTLSVGALSNIGDGGLDIASGAVLNLLASQLSQGTIDSLILGGTAYTAPGTYGSSLSGATFINDTFFSGTGFVTLVPVPEPAALALLGLGGLVVISRRRPNR